MSWTLWLAIAALAVAVVALVVALGLRAQQTRQRRAHGDEALPVEEPPVEDDPRELVAFVANPSKPDVAGLEAVVRAAFADAALPDPLWFETTVEDPGVGQTRAALAQGADVVVAVGGDGTVRAVAEGMVGSGRTMGLVPVGTGNLLARNLDLPVGDTRAALAVVIAGSDRPVDVGWVKVLRYAEDVGHAEGAEPVAAPDPARDAGTEHIFLVIAGLGFDAAMVADTDDDLKAKVGWVAYFVAGIRHLHGRRMRARIQLDDSPPVDARLRSLLIGNCGRLPGGLTLLPDAVIDDGILDIAAIDTRGGVVGWAQLFGEVVMQGLGVRNDLPAKIGRIDHARARRVRVRVEDGEQAQVDGDVLGLAVEIESRVDPGALVVRTA
ncbi:diacylglycerol kinase family enzyme [Cellulosimicrobium cellulans]|uniref:diacylglycerol/lipid kinase family protein n=1 Tax=Cellulosimicrobium cellulans TaxID=1710 RepID=UPI00195E8E3C|nr:diacylglycerol kinase family protein [Cellulosimicrobium cellulans]MBM7818341.1 diacylglycerol kinase family enzyme [Cellulosimicrobium cellulans]